MIINEKRQLTDDEFNRLTWFDVLITPKSLTELFSGKTIIAAETVDYPHTTGIICSLLDDFEQLVFADISVDDNLVYGNPEDCRIPLTIRISEPVTVTPSPA